ncbi:MAG: hypothetical protein JWQ77_2471 [Jatrophihabitans sp.]|nr:hypothetical protein [Jatrophihabitans sp.]
MCLLLAVSSALGSSRGSPPRPAPLAGRLHAGQVAVPVTLGQASSAFVQVGDRVGLYATDTSGGSARPAELIADRLLVLRVVVGEESASLLVAAGGTAALHIAQDAGGQLLAVLDRSP